MKVRFFNIAWDTDGEDIGLSKEVTLEVENGTDVWLEGADVLSDQFGFCVHGFEFEIIP